MASAISLSNGAARSAPSAKALPPLAKCTSGIHGLDAVTGGGLPRGRPILVCGGAGSGKTLFGMQFLVYGIRQHDEPGVFVSFEERERDLAENVASLGFDLAALVAERKLIVEPVTIERGDVFESGEYSLDGLFVRLGLAIDAIGAKRVVLDTIEALFAALTNLGILRTELSRLFAWLKDKGVTTIVTGERGDGALTRHGLEEYVSDCVIVLDQRINDEIATRRLRIVKYRGSAHGSNEYPFLIDARGFSMLPVTTIDLNYAATNETVSSGVDKLDLMFAGRGHFRGNTILVSGTAGTGKSSLGAHFVDAGCRRGERCAYFAYEEPPEQIVRNMRSIGVDLAPWTAKGLLRLVASRPTSQGLESALGAVLALLDEFQPRIIVVDPISALQAAGEWRDARVALMRIVDLVKTRHITALFTTLTAADGPAEQSVVGVSSLIDTWLVLRNLDQAGERTRTLSIVKSRGMEHSSQTRELILTGHGVDLVDVFVGPDGRILTGSARTAQQMADRSEAEGLQREIRRQKAALLSKRKAMEARIAEIEAEFAVETEDLELSIAQREQAANAALTERGALARQREDPGSPDAEPSEERMR